jgi:transketolase
VIHAVEHEGPLYLRLTRQKVRTILPPDYRYEFGKAVCLRPGTDVTLAGTGGVVANCLEAADLLKAEGIEAEVLNVHTIHPLDEEGLLASVGRTGRVVTVEDHSVRGGLGGAVAELLSGLLPTPVRRLGVEGFGESGDPKRLYAKHGLDPGGIARSVKKFLNR